MIMFSVITNIYNKKTPNAYAEPSTLFFFDIDNSLAAVPVDFVGLCRKLAPNPFNVIFSG
jgi:hypothetical protein